MATQININQVDGLQAALDSGSSESSYAKGNVTGATTVTLSDGDVQSATATGNVTWTFSGAASSGTISAFTLELTNGGAYTMTWPASVKWANGIAPTLTAAGKDILEFYTGDAGTVWIGALAVKDAK